MGKFSLLCATYRYISGNKSLTTDVRDISTLFGQKFSSESLLLYMSLSNYEVRHVMMFSEPAGLGDVVEDRQVGDKSDVSGGTVESAQHGTDGRGDKDRASRARGVPATRRLDPHLPVSRLVGALQQLHAVHHHTQPHAVAATLP